MKQQMRMLAGFGLAAFILAGCSRAPIVEPDPADIEAARSAAGALGSALQGELVAAMREGGPIAAVEVCDLRAPAIASTVSDDQGLQVGRTALKLRNLDNAPDNWEAGQLLAFMDEIAEGADPAALEAAAIVEMDGQQTFRWMKPIMMGGACAACHGVDIPADVADEIAARYPDDAATGFSEGDLRGAFTVHKTLD